MRFSASGKGHQFRRATNIMRLKWPDSCGQKGDSIHKGGKSKRATMGDAVAAAMMSDLFDISSRVRELELKEDRDFLAVRRGGGNAGTSATLTVRRQTALGETK